MAAVADLQLAIQALHGTDEELRRVADAHLKEARRSDGFWVVALQLLTAQGASPYDQFFGAHALRTAVQRSKDVVAPEAARALAAELGRMTAAAAEGQHWAIANQLAGALAELAIRAPWWGVDSLVLDTLQLLGAGQALQAHHHHHPQRQDEQQQGQGQAVTIDQSRLHAALLVLACLPEACLSGGISVHPARRAAAIAVLASYGPIARVVELSLQASPACQLAGLQLVQAWAALPGAAAALQLAPSIVGGLHRAVLHSPGLATEAAGAVAALYGACAAAGTLPPHALLQGLLPHLAGTVGGVLQAAVQQSQHGAQLLNAAATILSAAGVAIVAHLCTAAGCMLPWEGSAAGQQEGQEWTGTGANGGVTHQPEQVMAAGVAAATSAAAVGEEAEEGQEERCAAWWDALAFVAASLLGLLQHPDPNVVLSSLQPWDDSLIPGLQLLAARPAQRGPPSLQQLEFPGQGEENPGQQQWQRQRGPAFAQRAQQLLERLCGGLLQRMTLPVDMRSSQATADARDLPEGIRMVRRELSDTFRAAASAVGTVQAVQHLLSLGDQAQVAWQAGGDPSRDWQQLECSLYALNLVLPKHAAVGGPAQQAAHRALHLCVAALDSTAPKLAGTALTLLGGLAEALAGLGADSGPLPAVLAGLLGLLDEPSDPKLSRNAATAVHRLCSHPKLAAQLAAAHAAWAQRLAALYCGRGGLRQAPRGGEDISTEEFLLRALCHLARASACVAGAQAERGPGMQALLPQLVRQAASQAGAALVQLQSWHQQAATTFGAGSVQLPLAVAMAVQQCGVQLEAVAVVLGSGFCPGAVQQAVDLPLLEEIWWVAEGAVKQFLPLIVGREPQQLQQLIPLLQGSCSAVAATARAVPLPPVLRSALLLLQPLAANPAHTCVLGVLGSLAASAAAAAAGCSGGPAAEQQGEGEEGLLMLLAQTLTAAFQATSCHWDDPGWAVAGLGLGAQAARQSAVLAAGGPLLLQQLLGAAQRGAQSYHREVCEATLQLAGALCCGAGTVAIEPGTGAAAVPADAAACMCQDARQQRQSSSEGASVAAQQRHCVGAQVVLWLLLAVSGSMPPYMMLPIAEALHSVWRTVGSDRFGHWMGLAALELAPPDAPWRGWKPDAMHAALADLLSQQSMQDEKRFKRQLKLMCGGKKKGRHVGAPPARGL